MKAKEIFLLVSSKLQDLEGGVATRWPWEITEGKLSLTDAFNAAVRNIALQRPDATAITESIKLQDGVKQVLPDPANGSGASKKALRLIEVIQNMGSDGNTPDEPIMLTSKAAMQLGGWTTTSDDIDNYAYDAKENPDIYWVQPGVAVGALVYISMTYSAEPDHIDGSDDDLPISPTFSGPIVHWMIYELLSGDSSTSSMATAQFHFSAFYQALGVKLKADLYYPKQIQVVKE
ncbi:DUF6682 family protein [Maridesulfovibrio ferrireducens]|uniref:phage adaptor protein n=1 Tax=Maridesulfovibrio ferrireducens TaxID=246191 RepID=UPI001A1ECE86|nr:DUF6682 family protein [Maridesulfovibrio ferrireducens]MBI9113138.1 hypothetical protein [Maridesulfovibrio ferrireducens]